PLPAGTFVSCSTSSQENRPDLTSNRRSESASAGSVIGATASSIARRSLSATARAAAAAGRPGGGAAGASRPSVTLIDRTVSGPYSRASTATISGARSVSSCSQGELSTTTCRQWPASAPG